MTECYQHFAGLGWQFVGLEIGIFVAFVLAVVFITARCAR